jgi:transcriptional regulator with XRE-family HTH domain
MATKPPDVELARRMFLARSRREQALGADLTLADIAEGVRAYFGRDDAPADSVVRRWIKGLSEPDRPTFRALASVFDVDAGWLAFGDATPADATDDADDAVAPVTAPPALVEEERRRLAAYEAGRRETTNPPHRGRRAGGKSG